MNKWICLASLLLVTGCATARYRPYVGNQQAWPVGEGTIVNVRYELPIFTSLPPAPYEVLGEIRVESPIRERPDEGDMPAVVQKAKAIGADAVLFVQGRIYFSTNYGRTTNDNAVATSTASLTQVNTFNPDSFEPGVTMLAIRWTGEPPPGLKKQVKSAAPPTPTEAAEPAPAAPPLAAPAPAPTTPPMTTPAPAPTAPKTNFGPRAPGE